MLVLLGIGFVAGVITAISPCVLPVLPIILAGGATGGGRRPFAIIAGLVASFTLFTLTASVILSALGLPQDFLRDVAIGLLFLLALTLVVPRIGLVLERPFAFLTRRRGGDLGGGFLLGASLGLVFVPCAGPVLATITVLSAQHRVGTRAVFLTLSGLRGKVVLVDFWTYSCINCIRTLPHLRAWYDAYHRDGFEIVGVHTPEFAFEHVLSNVRQATHDLRVSWPVALDNDYKTWTAYSNAYWP